MKRNYSGFTLLNLLITITISSLLVTTGIPSLTQVFANYQANNTYNQLFTLIQFTRIQAVNYKSQVLLCPTINQMNCVSDWNQELMVFVDLNNDETRDDEELLLYIREEISNEDESINWRVSGRNQSYLRYKPDGSTRNQNGRLTYCLRKGGRLYARQIIMYRTGRARKASEAEAINRCPTL